MELIVILIAIIGLILFGVYTSSQKRQGEARIKAQDELIKIQNSQVEAQNEQISIQKQQVEMQNKQIEVQSEGNAIQMLNAAIALLGNSEASVRIGAIYSLYDFALSNNKYRNQVVKILCSHIRSKTSEKTYQEEYKNSPSDEIQTTINLLFKNEEKQENLYHDSDSQKADLSSAYLVGADLKKAYCKKADFRKTNCAKAGFLWTNCEQADFGGANCETVIFAGANCSRANFKDANCVGAYFGSANCVDAIFWNSNCMGADFGNANCVRAGFVKANCIGVDFSGWATRCESASFRDANCMGANFKEAFCIGANFSSANCAAVNFSGAHCQYANFDKANCFGAYANDDAKYQKLVSRIGKETQLISAVISGQIDEKVADHIERAVDHLKLDRFGKDWEDWQCWILHMQKRIEENKEKPLICGKPEGIIEGVLEDSEELRTLIGKLEEIEKQRESAFKSWTE